MIYSLVVTRNEQNRYLRKVLSRLMSQVDGVYVYDDQSEDDTVEVANSVGAVTRIRHDRSVSFMDDESKFRSDALRNMVKDMNINEGDWIIAVDADEILVTDTPLKELIGLLSNKSYTLKVNEVFDVSDIGETPYVRVDGFWGDIYSPRMFVYDGDIEFSGREMGSGSVPKKFLQSPILSDVEILHYGYAEEEDRVVKYARYFGRPGHNVKHVDSILRHPVLVRWDGRAL